jgi:glycosyltransferase involved in cell wall biosynthesis
LVSYVTVVKNNVATLGKAIESVQGQTYPAVEHVILDGASTDGTLDVIRRFADRIDYFASAPDLGLYDALNKAIPLARGDLICVLNSDDWLEPSAAETAVALSGGSTAPRILLTAANARREEPEAHEAPVVLEWSPAQVHLGCYLTCADDCHNGIYASRSAYERSGPYDTTFAIAADFKWLMSCFEAGVEISYTRTITVNYVLGGVSADAERHGVECVRVLRERFPSLTADEAGGLYHSFFAFPTFPSIPGRRNDRADFLDQLLTRHSNDPDLASAVAWALVADDKRTRAADSQPAPEEALHTSSSPVQFVKATLQGHPRTYALARRLYTGLFRT